MSDNNGPAGHPMNEIAKQFHASAEPAQIQDESEDVTTVPSAEPGASAAADAETPPAISSAWGPVSLSPDQIEAPAFFVDKQLSVQWLAPGSADALIQVLGNELNSGGSRNIFNLLLRPAVKEASAHWQAFFSFVYVMLRRSTSREVFDTGTVFIARDQRPMAQNEPTHGPEIPRFQVESCILESDGTLDQPPLRIFGLEFGEGTLFLLRRDEWIPATEGHGRTETTTNIINHSDQKASICMLSARLNQSHRIADTMLPEEFFKLMNLVWEEADDVIHSLGGLRAGCSGAQIHYVFKANMGRNPIFSALCCATRMNSRMQALEEKLRAQQGWADDICMNMGISHGKDDLTDAGADSCMEFMIPGGALDQSSHLSAVAAKDEIWVTKDAIAQLPKKLIDQVVLGVDRQGQFRRNFFTRISDLPQENLPDQPKADLGALSVAKVLKIEKPGTIHPEPKEV